MNAFRLLRFRPACRPGQRTKAQTLVEYTLILGMISVLALSVFSALGNRVVYVFSAITSLLDTAQSP